MINIVDDTQQYISWFRHSSPYINAHRNKTFVILISGEAVEHDNFHNIVHDIALLSSLGVRLVLVHGSRTQIDAQLKLDHLTTGFHQGKRITHKESLNSVIKAVASVRVKIEALFSMGLVNSPMHGSGIRVSSGNYLIAKPLGVIDGVDFEHTGEPRSIDVATIKSLLDSHHIVLLPNIGYSPTGETFNLNVASVAQKTAIALQADKLICFSPEEGFTDKQGNLIKELNAKQTEHVFSDQHAQLFQASAHACIKGVKRAHIISYKIDGALIQELFTRDGCGTLISVDPYENLRQATINDVGGVLELIAPLEEQGILVKRSRELLETEIDQFTVIERDGHIIGCAALYTYAKDKLAELACITVHPDYREGRRGEQMLTFLEKQAQSSGFEKIFVLTTQTAHWFQERGFIAAHLSELPMEKQDLYNYQRNSLIFTKNLKK